LTIKERDNRKRSSFIEFPIPLFFILLLLSFFFLLLPPPLLPSSYPSAIVSLSLRNFFNDGVMKKENMQAQQRSILGFTWPLFNAIFTGVNPKLMHFPYRLLSFC